MGRVLVLLAGVAGAAFGISLHASPTPAQGAVVDVPSGGLVYTTAAACPAGFSDASFVSGRLIVGTTTADEVGDPFGNAMPSDAAPTHTHDVSFSVTLPNRTQSHGALNGPNAGNAGTYPFAGPSSPSHSGAPLLQLRACRKP